MTYLLCRELMMLVTCCFTDKMLIRRLRIKSNTKNAANIKYADQTAYKTSKFLSFVHQVVIHVLDKK